MNAVNKKRGVKVSEEKDIKQEDLIQETDTMQDEATEEVSEQEEVAIEEVLAKIAALEAENKELEDKYYRSQAEMANMHTRFKKEQAQMLKYAGQDLAKAILPALDNLSRAVAIEASDENIEQLKRGVELVINNLTDALAGFEVVKIASLGEKFDPNVHQAVQTVPLEDGQEAETIVQVFQEGYMFKDRVLRPAMVVVTQ